MAVYGIKNNNHNKYIFSSHIDYNSRQRERKKERNISSPACLFTGINPIYVNNNIIVDEIQIIDFRAQRYKETSKKRKYDVQLSQQKT